MAAKVSSKSASNAARPASGTTRQAVPSKVSNGKSAGANNTKAANKGQTVKGKTTKAGKSK